MAEKPQSGQPVVLVTVPAHNEANTIEAAVTSIVHAAAVAAVRIHIVVVADRCTDETAQRAVRAGAEVLTTDGGVVGTARTAGFRQGLRTLGANQPCWMATTDADSTVPHTWLSAHLQLAAIGADLVIGTVDLSPVPGSDPLRDQWLRTYGARVHGASHPHIHGANLGFTPVAFELLGGFGALSNGEDVDFVRRAEAAGMTAVRTWLSPVMTSRRDTGRAPDGFAAYLKALGRVTDHRYEVMQNSGHNLSPSRHLPMANGPANGLVKGADHGR